MDILEISRTGKIRLLIFGVSIIVAFKVILGICIYLFIRHTYYYTHDKPNKVFTRIKIRNTSWKISIYGSYKKTDDDDLWGLELYLLQYEI